MLIGKRISGRYQILRVIGGGGMANVYLAEDMILDREVAIKILRFDFASDDDFIRRFRREAQSAASLDHSNIVSIYDVGKKMTFIILSWNMSRDDAERIHTCQWPASSERSRSHYGASGCGNGRSPCKAARPPGH